MLLLLFVLPGCPSRPTPGPTPRPAPPAHLGPKVLFHGQSPFGDVYVVADGAHRFLRFGAPDAEDQSAYNPRRPRLEPLAYVRTALLGLAYVHHPARVLMVGLGGGSFLRHLRPLAPRSAFEAVEINPVVVTACRRYFGFQAAGEVTIHVMDGRRFIQRAGHRYDLVFLDAYDSVDYPRHLGTREFFALVRRLLTPTGVVVANLSPNQVDRRNALVKTFRAAFQHSACYYTPLAGNTLVFGGPGVQRPGIRPLQERIQELDHRTGHIHQLLKAAAQRCPFNTQNARILTDRPPSPGHR